MCCDTEEKKKPSKTNAVILFKWHFYKAAVASGSTPGSGLFNGGEEFIISIVCRETLPRCLTRRTRSGCTDATAETLLKFFLARPHMLFLCFSFSQGIFWLFDTDPRRGRNTTGPPYLFSELDETGNRSANSNPRWRIAADSDFFHTFFFFFALLVVFEHPFVYSALVQISWCYWFGLEIHDPPADDSFRISVSSS